MDFILTAVIVLGALGLIAAVILYVCSKKFAVKEDPRIGSIAALLPQANCGGCGYPGCGGLASAIVKGADNGSIDGFFCPVGGQDVMNKVADTLGMTPAATEPRVAVVRCNGTCANRPKTVRYSGLRTCKAMSTCGAGETACGYGCLGCGDCVKACQFGGITINEKTGLPEVDEDKCTACGACAKACPRKIIELRKKGIKNRRVFVSCVNKEKGAIAMKGCAAACIGCGKCVKECAFGAITLENNVAYIDAEKCKLCRKCEKACPRHAIIAVNFPAPKPKPETATANNQTAKTTDAQTKTAAAQPQATGTQNAATQTQPKATATQPAPGNADAQHVKKEDKA